MTSALRRIQTPVVIDTNVAGQLLTRHPGRPVNLPARYQFLQAANQPVVVSFVTVAELRYGAFNANWGERKLANLEAVLSRMTVVMPDSDLVTVCARLRATCKSNALGLHDKVHEADRWIAATAMRYGLALCSEDRIFRNVPGLALFR